MCDYHTALSQLNQYLPVCINQFIVLPYIDFYEYERREVVNELNYKFREASIRSYSFWVSLEWYFENPRKHTIKHWIDSRLFYICEQYSRGAFELRDCYQYTCANPLHPDNKRSTKEEPQRRI